jgi:hypothetical protein
MQNVDPLKLELKVPLKHSGSKVIESFSPLASPVQTTELVIAAVLKYLLANSFVNSLRGCKRWLCWQMHCAYFAVATQSFGLGSATVPKMAELLYIEPFFRSHKSSDGRVCEP